MRKFFAWFLFLCLTLPWQGPAHAVNPDEILSDPALEQRARELSVGIRCLVCQNQSIDDSDADLARELRILVREKLTEGLEDQEILDFLVERYGEFVLLKPPFNTGTALLWAAPFALLLAGGIAIFFLVRRRNTEPQAAAAQLSDSEAEKLSKLLKSDD